MPKLTYTIGGAEKTVEVTDSCSIGRLDKNTISLPDEQGASRHHCQIMKISSGFELTDLGSTNGTKVNGQKVKRHKLKGGDKIEIGDTALVWDDGTGGGDDVVLEGDVQLEEPAGAAPAARTPGAATSEQCCLVFAGGPKDGQRIALEKKRITFGRNPKNTYVFENDTGVSGYHCEVAREGGAYVLRDLGSTNGTLVDGEQVTEIALQHGNRIRIGAQRLVFVDPTVSDFEKAMSAVEDLGSEWGLLRAEMDMSRVQQARRSQMIGVAFAVLLLAGGAYLAMNPGLITGEKIAIVPIPGNQVRDFSFESGQGTWAVLPDSPAQGRYVDSGTPPAAQGKTCYSVTREGAPGRGAAVAAGNEDRIKVSPTGAYTFGAQVRTTADAQACVRVTWISAEGKNVVGESATDLVSGSSWTKVQQSIAQPPKDTVFGRLELVNAGGSSGAAFFDDVFFAPASQAPPVVDAKNGDLAASITADGQLSLRRGSVTLLRDLCAVSGAFSFDLADPSRWTDRVGSRKGSGVSGSGTGGKMTGQTFDPVKNQWQPFTVSAQVPDGRYADLEIEVGEHGALLGVLPKEFIDEGLAVKTETANVRMTEARSLDKVLSVTFGNRNRFQVAAAEGSPSFRFILLRTADGWAAGFGGTGTVKLRIDTDSKEIGKADEELERKAKDAEQRHKLGDAVNLFRELAARLPQGSQLAGTAAEQVAKYETAAKQELEAVQTGRLAAVEFQDDAALNDLASRAATLVQQYENHPVGASAKTEVSEIRTALERRRVILHERLAAPILRKARDGFEQQDFAFTAALCRSILAGYPGTEAAKEAKDVLAKLPAGN